ncbi:MAG: tetratricopeptide repeat protein [Bacteroidetes bacterium]|nr:tetratricopeptide repeat protein [Bacteroidota bacterium]
MHISKQFAWMFFFMLYTSILFSTTVHSNFTTDYLENFTFNIQDDELQSVKELLENGNIKDALEKLYLFIEAVEIKNDSLLIVESKILLAEILRDNGDYQKSNEIFEDIIPLIKLDFKKSQYVFFKRGGNFQLDNNIDSAKVNYEKALFFAEKVQGNDDLRAKMHANLSGIYYLKEDYDNAIEHSKIAANYQKTLGNIEIEAGILNNLGGIYYMKGEFNEALNVFQEALDLVDYGQSDLQKKTRSTSFINMAYAYSELGNYKKAFELQDRYFSLNDSIQQALKYKEITEIESKYDLAKKEKEAVIEKAKRQKAELLTYGLGVAIFILLLGIYALYKLVELNKQNHTLEITQEQLINKSKLEKVKSESQSKILVATMDGRIEERKKISDILHGNVSALLSAANLHLYAGGMQFNGNVPIEIEKTQNIIAEASIQVRELSHNLVSAILLKQGLSLAIEDICKKSSNETIKINCESKNMDRFNNNFEIKLFNIIQELINNMLKHSNAKKGTVKLEQLNGRLQVLVVDNGIGFDVDYENADAGIGLSQIKARVGALKGLLSIDTSEKGTRTYISTPIVY